jgi:hypothetical protein
MIAALKTSGAELTQRPIVGMGYSGGFVPLIEGLATVAYNVTSVVGLGAATISLPRETIDAVIAVIHYVEGKVVDAITWALDKLSIIGELAAQFLKAIQEKAIDTIITILRNALSPLQKVPITPLSSLADHSAEFALNVWGTEDILYETGIAGPRENLAGLPTVNVEIVGATHFDYMRRDDADMWNITVSQFVTRLLENSRNETDLIAFLQSWNITPDSRGVWVVNL